jgi:hypothetical protein
MTVRAHIDALPVAIAVAVATAAPRLASAQAAPAPAPVEADPWIDGSITIGAGLAAFALTRLPVDTTRRWQREPLGGLDGRLRGRLSSTAAAISDLLLVTSIAAPVFTEIGRGRDDQTDDRLLVYGEALTTTLVINSGVKYLVQRPRPYAYHADPAVAAYAARQGKDSRLSFYSGHAATAFTAATTGGYLYAAGSDDAAARATVWATGAVLASLTSVMRVRAGKHFYSDVLAGGAVGVAVGWIVPRLHHDGGIAVSAGEWAAAGGGVVVGALAGLLVPMPEDVVVEIGGVRASRVEVRAIAVEGGGGIGIGGVLR